MQSLANFKIKIFADGADKAALLALNADELVKGITTNPTLMRKAGIADYEKFAREILNSIKDKPISFEVFSDEFPEMRRQALKISEWQKNVYVKIPVTNTRAEPSLPLIRELAHEGVRLNITAILTPDQVRDVVQALDPKVPSVVSVFAGRIADTGRDPVPLMQESLKLVRQLPKAELLWASVREVLNIVQAELCGCDIVTVPPDILKKARSLWQKDLAELSLDTVKMFAQDAISAEFKL
jgi:transaldolase